MRSEYVYLIFQDITLLSVHTVKYEARLWFDRSGLDTGEVSIYRMRDGGKHGKMEELVRIPWDEFKA
jgi:hypothetical protein